MHIVTTTILVAKAWLTRWDPFLLQKILRLLSLLRSLLVAIEEDKLAIVITDTS
jgi:hypothetical protein